MFSVFGKIQYLIGYLVYMTFVKICPQNFNFSYSLLFGKRHVDEWVNVPDISSGSSRCHSYVHICIYGVHVMESHYLILSCLMFFIVI